MGLCNWPSSRRWSLSSSSPSSGLSNTRFSARRMSERSEALRQIRDEVVSLSASPLFAYRTENHYFPVIGEGSHEAALMFVGEAPGENEAKTGRPFCGRAGKVL